MPTGADDVVLERVRDACWLIKSTERVGVSVSFVYLERRVLTRKKYDEQTMAASAHDAVLEHVRDACWLIKSKERVGVLLPAYDYNPAKLQWNNNTTNTKLNPIKRLWRLGADDAVLERVRDGWNNRMTKVCSVAPLL